MNEKFQQYTTNTAFRLDLSKSMVAMLLEKYAEKQVETNPNDIITFRTEIRNFIATGKSLENRGLLKDRYCIDGKGRKTRLGYQLTQEGEKVCELLLLAGFEIPVIEKHRITKWPMSELTS